MAEVKATQVKMVTKKCLVANITIGDVEHKDVKGKQVQVPEHLVAVLERHEFIEKSDSTASVAHKATAVAPEAKEV